jgi:polynucleotide 5'-triphosphatase
MRTPQPPSERIQTPQSTTNSSSSETRQTPQPASRPRRYAEVPIWARKEADGFIPTPTPKRANPAPLPVMPSPTQQPAPRPSPAPAGPPPPTRISNLEPSLDNHIPYNDMSRLVANWLWDKVIETPDYGPGTHIEIEAKLGQLQDTDMRIALPIASEAVMTATGQRLQFKSMMSMAQHRRLNEYLNHAVREAKLQGRSPMTYKHTRETDKFYQLPSQFLQHLNPEVRRAHESSGKAARVRVTRDDQTGQVMATIIKLRMADLEVFCPNDDFDFRISVSLETAWPHPIESLQEHLERGVSQARGKDRLSYTHQGFQVDLTQVTPVSNAKEKVHELEIELEAKRLKDEASKISRGIASDYEDLVSCFLNNIRVLNRAAKAPPGTA